MTGGFGFIGFAKKILLLWLLLIPGVKGGVGWGDGCGVGGLGWGGVG